MKALNRGLVVAFLGLFAGTVLTIPATELIRSHFSLADLGASFWLYAVFGIVLIALATSALMSKRAPAFIFTMAPNSPPWVGIAVFSAIVLFVLFAFIAAVRSLFSTSNQPLQPTPSRLVSSFFRD